MENSDFISKHSTIANLCICFQREPMSMLFFRPLWLSVALNSDLFAGNQICFSAFDRPKSSRNHESPTRPCDVISALNRSKCRVQLKSFCDATNGKTDSFVVHSMITVDRKCTKTWLENNLQQFESRHNEFGVAIYTFASCFECQFDCEPLTVLFECFQISFLHTFLSLSLSLFLSLFTHKLRRLARNYITCDVQITTNRFLPFHVYFKRFFVGRNTWSVPLTSRNSLCDCKRQIKINQFTNGIKRRKTMSAQKTSIPRFVWTEPEVFNNLWLSNELSSSPIKPNWHERADKDDHGSVESILAERVLRVVLTARTGSVTCLLAWRTIAEDLQEKSGSFAIRSSTCRVLTSLIRPKCDSVWLKKLANISFPVWCSTELWHWKKRCSTRTRATNTQRTIDCLHLKPVYRHLACHSLRALHVKSYATRVFDKRKRIRDNRTFVVCSHTLRAP
jgi:hypothetical protein